MTKQEFDEMTALVVRLRTDLELHTDALVKSNAQCAEYLRKTEQMQAEHERLLRVCNDYEDAAADMHRELVSVRAALAATGVPLHDASDMTQAVAIAADAARSGDAVLLSPACASFDMFDNHGHRAQVFIEAVQAMAHDAGAELQGGA